MLARRIRLPQSAVPQCRCLRGPVARFSTKADDENSPFPSCSSPSTPPTPSSPPQPSLYDKLFPGKKPASAVARPPAPRPSPTTDESPEPSHEETPPPPPRREQAAADEERDIDVSHVGDELRAWLEEVGAAAAAGQAQAAEGKPNKPKPKTKAEAPTSKTVIVLSSMSRSLVESDFHRWAHQGRHLAGWAGGLSKVVQAISTATREPRGQYFLFFNTRAAALACEAKLAKAYAFTQEAQRAHQQQQQQQPVSTPASSSKLPPLAEPDSSQATAPNKTPSTQQQQQQASLRPPTTPLQLLSPPRLLPASHLHILVTSADPREQAPTSAADRAQRIQQRAQQARWGPARTSPVPYGLGVHLRIDRPSRDLSWSVLVRLEGSKVAVATLTAAIAADGAARNLAWRLVEDRPEDPMWPRPVQALRAGSGKIRFGEEEEEMARERGRGRGEWRQPEYGYERFVLTFNGAPEARRFARAWHRREMVDERTTRVMTVNATALW